MNQLSYDARIEGQFCHSLLRDRSKLKWQEWRDQGGLCDRALHEHGEEPGSPAISSKYIQFPFVPVLIALRSYNLIG